MEQVFINLGERSYNIAIGAGLLTNIQDYVGAFDTFALITDDIVDTLYAPVLYEALGDKKVYKILIRPGEGSKSIQVVERVLTEMLDFGLDRSSAVIALGGGVVGDVAGFGASVYMRGIPLIQVPTTLLAQVDSSVGGKTGVNLPAGKNTVGCFYQPQAVVIDTTTLRTLPKRHLVSGMAEVIKYGVIYDYDFLVYLRDHFSDLLDLKGDVVTKVIKRCCEIKAEVVAKDEREAGLRKILNFGHTIGHALEVATQYQTYTHGEAVWVGMYLETLLAHRLGLIDQVYLREIRDLIIKSAIDLEIDDALLAHLMKSMLKDKKNRDGKISFILPAGKGVIKEVLLTQEDLSVLFASSNTV